MVLIQFQKYSEQAVSCPFAPYRQNRRCTFILLRTHMCTRTRARCVQGFINWITLTKRPPKTREHPALRKETGHSKRLSSPFSSLRRPTLLYPLPFHLYPSCFSSSSSPPPPASSSHDLVSFAETGYGDWRTGITIPFVRPAGSDVADFKPAFLSRFECSGKTPRLYEMAHYHRYRYPAPRVISYLDSYFVAVLGYFEDDKIFSINHRETHTWCCKREFSNAVEYKRTFIKLLLIVWYPQLNEIFSRLIHRAFRKIHLRNHWMLSLIRVK